MTRPPMPLLRRIALLLWMGLIVVFTGLYLVEPEWLSPSRLATVLRESGQPLLLGYAVLSVVRPFTLVPSTVLIVVGALLFPSRPGLVMICSLAGVVASAGLIYYYFEFLGLTDLFERRYGPQIRRLEDRMQRRGFWIVVGWSAFPFVPTDVICYVAGTLRMNIWRFLGGVALGELPIVTFYVLAGRALVV